MAGEFLSHRLHVREPRQVESGKIIVQDPDVSLMYQAHKIAPIIVGEKIDEKRMTGVKAGVVRVLTEPGVAFTAIELAEKVTGKIDDASLETTRSIVTGLNEDLEKHPYHIVSNTAPDGIERMSIAPKETIVFSTGGITELHPPTLGKRTKAMHEVEKAHGLPGETIRDILQRFYWGNEYDSTKRSVKDIANLFGFSDSFVCKWMKIHEVPVRTHKEAGRVVAQTSEKIDYVVARAHSAHANEIRASKARGQWQKQKEAGVDPYGRARQAYVQKHTNLRERFLSADPKDILQRYCNLGFTDAKIAEILREKGQLLGLNMKVSSSTVRNWIRRYEVDRREGNRKTARLKEDGKVAVLKADKKGLLAQLATVNSRASEVLRLRYIESKTLGQVAFELEVTGERVRQIEERGLSLLDALSRGESIEKVVRKSPAKEKLIRKWGQEGETAGEIIRRLMAEEHMNKAKIAVKLNIHTTQVSAWLRE